MLRHPGGHPPRPPHDGTGLLTIGEPARGTGLTVRTIRYRSDEGVLHPVTRSSGGYRLYDAESVARLDLIRTLRELPRGRPHLGGAGRVAPGPAVPGADA